VDRADVFATESGFVLALSSSGSSAHPMRRYLFRWQRIKACPIYEEFGAVWGEYGYRRNAHADMDDRGGTVAWEVWHWPSNTVEPDWFHAIDAIREARRLALAETTKR
jgi:hypothetical protein